MRLSPGTLRDPSFKAIDELQRKRLRQSRAAVFSWNPRTRGQFLHAKSRVPSSLHHRPHRAWSGTRTFYTGEVGIPCGGWCKGADFTKISKFPEMLRELSMRKQCVSGSFLSAHALEPGNEATTSVAFVAPSSGTVSGSLFHVFGGSRGVTSVCLFLCSCCCRPEVDTGGSPPEKTGHFCNHFHLRLSRWSFIFSKNASNRRGSAPSNSSRCSTSVFVEVLGNLFSASPSPSGLRHFPTASTLPYPPLWLTGE